MSKFCGGLLVLLFLFVVVVLSKQPSLPETKKNTRNIQLTTAGEGT